MSIYKKMMCLYPALCVMLYQVTEGSILSSTAKANDNDEDSGDDEENICKRLKRPSDLGPLKVKMCFY
jgi:hypothetical protein